MVVFYNMTDSEVKSYPNFHLSLELNSQAISLLLIDKVNAKPIAIETIEFGDDSIKNSIERSHIVKYSNPQSVSCAIVNSYFTLTPASMYQSNQQEAYTDFSLPAIPKTLVKSDLLTSKEVVNSFRLTDQVKNELTSLFPQLTFIHLGSILIDSLTNGFHVNFSTPLEFEVVVINNDNLTFFNRYETENAEESLYYLGLVAEKLNLDLQKIKIGLSGFVDKKGETLSFWNQFIPKENLIFNEIEASQLNAISTHRFFALHKQFACVS